MAKTAVLNKETQDLIGIGQSPATAKLVYEGAGLTEDQVVLVTAKDFVASDRYPTFKDMCMTAAEREEADKKAKEKEEADAKKAADKEAKQKEREEKKAAKAAEQGDKPKRERAGGLEGPYYVAKPFPPTREDHPKLPIWKAIADNTDVAAAKAACPAENPKRMTNGVYTFNSEFRYFVRTGYVVMGEKPEQTEDADAEQETAA